jgi:hypothetical protein
MNDILKAALVGLDTMHAVEFARLLQDPAAPESEKVRGMRVSGCMRFSTPFQSEEGMDKRQKYLESLGVAVTACFNEAVRDCDVILMTIDDPSFHLEYFLKCAALGKPVYVDKPLADSVENSRRMIAAARKTGTRFFTASALRYDRNIAALAREYKNCRSAFVRGALGKAPSGSPVIWYAVHSFEILRLFMGPGAESVTVKPDSQGLTCHTGYKDGRSAVVSLIQNSWSYSGVIYPSGSGEREFQCGAPALFYKSLLEECAAFFRGETEAVEPDESLEIMSMLEAAEISLQTGKTAPVLYGNQ